MIVFGAKSCRVGRVGYGWMLVRYPSFFENMYWNGGGYRDGCNVYQSAKARIKIFSQSLNLLYTKIVVILRNGWCV